MGPPAIGLHDEAPTTKQKVDEVPAESLASSVLVYDGPRWMGVYERSQPPQMHDTPQGPAEVWVVRE